MKNVAASMRAGMRIAGFAVCPALPKATTGKRVHTKATKDKISKSVRKYNVRMGLGIRECKFCGNRFYPDRGSRKYCSVRCSIKGRQRNERGEISYRTFIKMLHRAFPSWKCPFCDWSETFHVHHIDGRMVRGAHDLDRLVMICPNHHSLADKGKLDREVLARYAIGNSFSEEELLDKFYYGPNFKVNHDKSRRSSGEECCDPVGI